MAEILISNKMTSQYNLVGYREVDARFELLVGNYQDSVTKFAIQARAIGKSNKAFSLDVKYAGTANAGFEIQPRINKHMGFEIEVNPHNKMSVNYELIEPPIHTWESFPVQDSYTLSQAPYSTINYGGNNSMLIGNGTRGEATSFVQFDLSKMDSTVRIKQAKLRLYYSVLNNTDISLHQVKESWQEYNITYMSQPQLTSFITSDYRDDTKDRYIEFDVTEVVAMWNLGAKNDGFMITSPENITTIFRTRESDNSPELIVEYFDNTPISVGMSKQRFKLVSRQNDDSKMKFALEVLSYYRNPTLGFSIFAHDPEFYYPSNLGFKVDSVAKVKILGESEAAFSITVIEDGWSDMGFSIDVPCFNEESNLGFSILPRLYKEKNMKFVIESNKVYNSEESTVRFMIDAVGHYQRRSDEMKFEITAMENVKDGESNLGFNILSMMAKEHLQGFAIDALTDYKRDHSNLGFMLKVPTAVESNMHFIIDAYKPPPVYKNRDSDQGFEVSARKFIVADLRFIIDVGIVEKDDNSNIYIM